ncbi:UNVERIFIED_CONTAM: hypothetical protein FKN15_028442 [Acipenser sinensis]
MTQEQRRQTHAVLRSVCHQQTASFSQCRPTMQPPQSYSVGGQRSSGQLTSKLTGKRAGTRSDHRARWCTVSRGHPCRPKLSLPWAALSQLCTAPWELQFTVGSGIEPLPTVEPATSRL